MKLSLGSNNKRIGEGWINVDILPLENVDIVHDLTVFPYPFETESIDEIEMTEFLEHISFRKTNAVLKECYRILKIGGLLHIQVPDIKEMMFAYWNGQICSCVSHKPKDKEDAMAKLDCPKCLGYGTVNSTRWLLSFLGAQKHEFDFHRNIFTPESIEQALLDANFLKYKIGKDKYGWKIKVEATKLERGGELK